MDTDDVLQAAGKYSIVDFEATSEIEAKAEETNDSL